MHLSIVISVIFAFASFSQKVVKDAGTEFRMRSDCIALPPLLTQLFNTRVCLENVTGLLLRGSTLEFGLVEEGVHSEPKPGL